MKDALTGFIGKIATDAALQAACSEAVARGDLEAVVRVAAEAGFAFTVEDLREAWAQQAAELSEDDLAKVAGGAGTLEIDACRLVPSCVFSGSPLATKRQY